ncbi:hypothetical protein FQN57_003102 [Myotisia sp. PD_48]|nr:hypothetical protein FQN57_003102 [Myotisia sp. PD_48]
MKAIIGALACCLSLVATSPVQNPSSAPSCRFSLNYSQKDILKDPSDYIWDLLYWEGKFHQNDVGYDEQSGMTWDGSLLDPKTGRATRKNPFSAASKEALQFMFYSHVIAGDRHAARFISPDDLNAAPDIAASILATKLKTYLKFNETYPGFGGFLPWFAGNSSGISPTHDWNNRVPALDNGELLWGVYGVVRVLETSQKSSFRQLARGWQKWLDFITLTTAKVFYMGKGEVCAVTKIEDQNLDVNDPKQKYACENKDRLDDPYEGELFTWWLYFFGGLSKQDKASLWEAKRAKLVSVEYKQGNLGPITVQKGFWFSSHEQWKVMQMPYYDVDIVRRVFKNAERVRTCNSVVTKNPGMLASVNNSTDTNNNIMGYISAAGIPSISFLPKQELDVITPYGVYPVLMFSKEVGLAWWKNLVDAKKMQNPYGSTESARRDGTAISSFVSWDSKMTTMNALLGGSQKYVREKMKKDGIYQEFLQINQREHSRVFRNLKGEDVEFCLPKATIPEKGLEDYTECS